MGNARTTPVTMQATPKVAMNQNQIFSPELSRPLLGCFLPMMPPPSIHHFRSPFSGRLLASHIEIINATPGVKIQGPTNSCKPMAIVAQTANPSGPISGIRIRPAEQQAQAGHGEGEKRHRGRPVTEPVPRRPAQNLHAGPAVLETDPAPESHRSGA